MEGTLPCPFCGGAPELLETGASQASGSLTVFRVVCADCGIYQDSWDEKQTAVNTWNTRACTAAERQRDAAMDALRVAREALVQGRHQFSHYELQHLDKQTAEGNAKADTNARFADIMSQALSQIDSILATDGASAG